MCKKQQKRQFLNVLCCVLVNIQQVAHRLHQYSVSEAACLLHLIIIKKLSPTEVKIAEKMSSVQVLNDKCTSEKNSPFSIETLIEKHIPCILSTIKN